MQREACMPIEFASVLSTAIRYGSGAGCANTDLVRDSADPLEAAMRLRVAIVGICAATLMFGAFGEPATARSRHVRKPAVTRQFAATFPSIRLNWVADSSCQGGRAIELSGVLKRPGIPDWTFKTYGCPTSVNGTMRLTTGRGVTIDGTIVFNQSQPTLIRFAFDLVSASDEYASGHLDFTMSADVPNATGYANGQFTTIARPR